MTPVEIWAEQILGYIEGLSAGTEFTTDVLHRRVGPPPGADSRAFGSVMTRARRKRLIEATGSYIKSTRAECKMRPLAVWRRLRDRR